MLHNGRDRDVPVAGDRHWRPVSGVDREALHTIDHHRFDVGDMRYSQSGELLLRQMPHIERHNLLARPACSGWSPELMFIGLYSSLATAFRSTVYCFIQRVPKTRELAHRSALLSTTAPNSAPFGRSVVAAIACDRNGLHTNFGLRLGQIDMKQTVIQPGTLDLDPLGQHERPLELPRRDAPMQENAALAVVCLSPSDHQLIVFLRDLKVVHGEPGNRERDAKPGRADLLDIIWRVSVG